MATTHKRKKNLIVSYKNLPDNLKEMFRELYPDGYNNHLIKFTKPNGDPIYVVPLETDDTAYMIKFDVQIDTMGDDLDKVLFDDDEEEGKEDDFAPLSEVIEKEEGGSHNERVLRHGDFESTMGDEQRKQKLTLGIDREEIKAALGEDDADELDSYDKIGDEENPDDDVEPSDEDLRDIEAEYLDAENPPLDATIPEEELVAPVLPQAKPTRKSSTAKKSPSAPAKKAKATPAAEKSKTKKKQ